MEVSLVPEVTVPERGVVSEGLVHVPTGETVPDKVPSRHDRDSLTPHGFLSDTEGSGPVLNPEGGILRGTPSLYIEREVPTLRVSLQHRRGGVRPREVSVPNTEGVSLTPRGP